MANSNRAATRRVQHVVQMIFSAFSLMLQHVLRFHVVAVLASIFMCAGIAHAAGANYIYDELSRLVQVIVGDGSSTQYVYDAAGNITAVKADAVNTLAISSFTPTSGGTGINVTVFGSGFSPTAASNTVTINNVAAAVTSASASQLKLTVPASATTGLITVSNANGSVTSTQAFTVGSTLSAPTIASFTPTVGAAGTAVTINGTNFQAGISNNKVSFGGVNGVITSLTLPGQAVAVVSSSAQSGKVTLQTTAGISTSSSDFFVVPAGVAVADVVTTGRITIGGAAVSPTINTAGKYAMLLFDGTSGQQLSLAMPVFTPTPSGSGWVSIHLYDPGGKILSSCSLPDPNGCQFSALPYNGTYRILVGIDSSHTASMSLLLSSVVNTGTTPNVATGILRIDDLPMPLNQLAGQNGRYTFDGVIGQRLGLGVHFDPVRSGDVNWSVLAPDGTTLTSCSSYTPGGGCILPQLIATGVYTVLLTPTAATTVLQGSMSLSSNVMGTLIPNAAATTFATGRNGQNGRYTFTAEAGDSYNLIWRDSTIYGYWSQLYVYAPDGSQVAVQNFGPDQPRGEIQLNNLSQSGTYAVLVVPCGGGIGQVAIQLLAPATGALALDGAPLTINQMAGQNGRYTFNGTVGQRIDLGALFSTSGSVGWSVLAPDGSTFFGGCIDFTPRSACIPPPLNTVGTYTVLVVPHDSTIVLQGALTLSSHVTGTLTPNAATTVFTTTRVGQTGFYSFNATAGDSYSLVWSAPAFDDGPGNGSWAYLAVYAPDGSQIIRQFFDGSSPAGEIQLNNLTQAGTYVAILVPSYGGTGQAGVRLLSNVAGALAVDGSPLAISQLAGQNGRYTFSGIVGQQLDLGAVLSSGGSVGWSVLGPDGSTFFNGCTDFSAASACILPQLNATGMYTVLVVPRDATTATQGALTLSSQVAGILTPDVATTFVTTRVGQTGRYKLSAAAGDSYSLAWNGATINGSCSYLYVYNPDGTQLSSSQPFGNGNPAGSLPLNNLAQTGSYTVAVVPCPGGPGGQVTLQLSQTNHLPAGAYGDPLWGNVSSLLRLNGANGSSAIADATGEHVWTAHGNAQESNAAGNPGDASGTAFKFDGNGDYADTPDAADLRIAGKSFTIDFWVYMSATASGRWRTIVSKRISTEGSTAEYEVFINNTDDRFGFYNGTLQITNTKIPVATWTHIEISKDISTGMVRQFMNGVKVYEAVGPNTAADTTAPVRLGMANPAQVAPDDEFFHGYLSNVRITTGVVRHTANFVPPPTPLPNLSPAVQGDPAWSNVASLLRFAGQNGSPSIIDETGAHAWTAHGNAQESNAAGNPGDASGTAFKFDGNGDYADTPDAADLRIAGKSFTIDFWVYMSATASGRWRTIVSKRISTEGSTAEYEVFINNTDDRFGFYNGTLQITNTKIPVATWSHIEISKDISTGVVRQFMNGVKVYEAVGPNTAADTTAPVRLGMANPAQVAPDDEFFHGYLSNVRITTGIVRHTANFTPPSTPFPNRN
ncbi:IPT/TIG domain-containing protein [Collimonas pratensis]|uniref:Polysaccharide lyase family protein n=1 Tax=Collimonas pratensis TaxID=279113 RepID=A0A127Q5P4_9BURK|nr:IPT/TIG domain-containing protein [Collimonas pratensis]AMP05354.1 polysaccharide lyase family protein [Collimonas pratensis]